MRYLKRAWLPGARAAFALYLQGLRLVRRLCFRRWLRSLRNGAAVVNLPHYFKSYSGRVVEGMAAGRPVISWELPERPRTGALFEEGREILLYPAEDPRRLAEQIRRVQLDRPFAERLAARARDRLLASHTTEWRVRQLLEWVTRGAEPQFT
jgi:glycosyltransferase involved in cell wall biosynthesis